MSRGLDVAWAGSERVVGRWVAGEFVIVPLRHQGADIDAIHEECRRERGNLRPQGLQYVAYTQVLQVLDSVARVGSVKQGPEAQDDAVRDPITGFP